MRLRFELKLVLFLIVTLVTGWLVTKSLWLINQPSTVSVFGGSVFALVVVLLYVHFLTTLPRRKP